MANLSLTQQNFGETFRNYLVFSDSRPLEEEEPYLSDDYVHRWQYSRRAHRMFRNIWHRRQYEFEDFKSLVEKTWPGMTVSPPERSGYPAILTMFCSEGRIDRELSWAGFGFQVWLQLLTHLLGARGATTLIVDEPEIYLHPDLQHKLFQLLKDTDKQIVLATHSSEIVNEAEHDDVVLVTRPNKTGRRVTDIEGLQEALFSIGSGQNIHLARLSRGRKILFLEGDDHRLLKRFSSRLGFNTFASDISITIVPLGGFTQRQRIEDAKWTFERVLRTEIAITAILDRDFRSVEEISEILQTVRETVPNFYVLERKEIENYLLVPDAISRAIAERLPLKRDAKIPPSIQQVEKLLGSLAEEMKMDVLSQLIANRMRFFSRRTAKDASTVAAEAISALDAAWSTLQGRLRVAPGKRLLTALNRRLQGDFGVLITGAQIIRHMSPSDVGADLREILARLNEFAGALTSEVA